MKKPKSFAPDPFVHIFVNDLDFSSIYPTLVRVLNISRATMKFTIFEITYKTVEQMHRLFINLALPKENAVWIFSNFFNLPKYDEMLALAEKEEWEKHTVMDSVSSLNWDMEEDSYY